jgi:ABC-type antimicrobial peptide transport system permease subunit
MPSGVVLKVVSMQDALDKAAAPWRVGATMLSIFAGLALLVASLGVYATASYDLTEREHEIGIRLALGATTRDLMRATIVRGLGLAVVGITAGTIVSFAVGSVIGTLLFNVSSRDPESFVIGAAVIAIAFIAASGAPALRAARADPSLILRSG